jgi:hypothetical protein
VLDLSSTYVSDATFGHLTRRLRVGANDGMCLLEYGVVTFCCMIKSV